MARATARRRPSHREREATDRVPVREVRQRTGFPTADRLHPDVLRIGSRCVGEPPPIGREGAVHGRASGPHVRAVREIAEHDHALVVDERAGAAVVRDRELDGGGSRAQLARRAAGQRHRPERGRAALCGSEIHRLAVSRQHRCEDLRLLAESLQIRSIRRHTHQRALRQDAHEENRSAVGAHPRNGSPLDDERRIRFAGPGRAIDAGRRRGSRRRRRSRLDRRPVRRASSCCPRGARRVQAVPAAQRRTTHFRRYDAWTTPASRS
jgi:hypothetical protein